MARKYLKVDEPRSLNKTNNQKSNTQAKPKRNSTLTKSSKYSSTSSLAENENSQISRSLSMKSDLESNGSQTSHTDLSQSNSKLYGNFHGSKESINNSKPDSITETPRSQGPQRVVRNLSTSTLTKPKLKPAQRITVAASSIPSMEKLNISVADEKSDSTMPESVVSPELKHSLFKRSSGIPQSSNASKSRIAALRAATTIPKKIINFKPPPGIQMEKAASLTRLNTESLNSDWAVRKEVYEQLEKFFLNTNGDTRDYLSAHSEKSFKMMINGLNDGHFKVVLAAQAALLAFIDCPDLPSSILDVLLPMVATVAFYPLQKTKLSIIEKSKDIVYKILLRTSPQTVGQSVANSLVNSPLSSKNRIGVIGFLNSLSLESLGLLFSKPIVCKALAVRLASFLSDQDPAVLAMLKAVFNNLWEVYPEYLIAGLANITLSDRDSLYHLTGKSFLTLPDAVQTSGLPALTISQFESPSETKQHLIESVALETPTKTVVSVIDIDLSDKTPKSDFKSSNLKSKKSVSLVSKNSTKKISETIKVVENQEVVGENEKQSLENIRIALDKKPEPRTISNLTPKQRESIAANRASLSKSQELNSDKSARRTPNSTLGSPTRVKSRKTPALLDEMETPKSSTKRVFVPLNDIVSAKAVVVPSPQLSVDGASPKKSMFSKMLESKSPVFGQVTPPSIDQQSLPSPSWSPSNEGKNTNPAIRKDARQESKLVTELPHFHNAADQTPKKRDSVLDNQRPDKSSPDSEKPETLQNLENGNIADLPNNATNSLGLSISGVSLEPTSSSENEISAPSTPRPRASSEAKRSLSIGRSSIRKRQESNTNTLAKLVNSFYVNVSIPLKKRLEDLYGALLALNSPIEQDMATSLLKCLFRLEDEEVILY